MKKFKKTLFFFLVFTFFALSQEYKTVQIKILVSPKNLDFYINNQRLIVKRLSTENKNEEFLVANYRYLVPDSNKLLKLNFAFIDPNEKYEAVHSENFSDKSNEWFVSSTSPKLLEISQKILLKKKEKDLFWYYVAGGVAVGGFYLITNILSESKKKNTSNRKLKAPKHPGQLNIQINF
jgi:hypothetical protein